MIIIDSLREDNCTALRRVTAEHPLPKPAGLPTVLRWKSVTLKGITPELEKKEIENIPLGRVGQPEDVADVIVFLASEQARWVTGQLIYVGGGHVMS